MPALALAGCVDLDRPAISPPEGGVAAPDRALPGDIVDAARGAPVPDRGPRPDAQRPRSDLGSPLPGLDAGADAATHEAICGQACGHLAGCIEDVCESAMLDYEACRADCDPDPDRFGAASVLAADCGAIQTNLCGTGSLPDGCGCVEVPTTVGAPCEAPAGCGAGGLPAGCIDTWPDGYCTGVGCGAAAPCPAGAACVQINEDPQRVCLAECEITDDCRAGYTCHDATNSAFCVPE